MVMCSEPNKYLLLILHHMDGATRVKHVSTLRSVTCIGPVRLTKMSYSLLCLFLRSPNPAELCSWLL